MARFWILPAGLLLCSCGGNPAPPPAPLRIAAATYPTFGLVDDNSRLAPEDCRPPDPRPLRSSASRDGTTHGKKLYYLFAKDRGAYLRAKDLDQPDGQVVVKESWISGDRKEKGPLFLMLKSQGEWIYATATPDGKEITASGKLPSCVKCHESAPHDKLFGLSDPRGQDHFLEER